MLQLQKNKGVGNEKQKSILNSGANHRHRHLGHIVQYISDVHPEK